MNKTWVLIKREYLTRIKTKGFIIGTLVMPIFVLVMTFFPMIMKSLSSPKPRLIDVYDASGKVFDALTTDLEGEKNNNGSPKFKLERLQLSEGQTFEDLKDEMNLHIQTGERSAALVIADSVFNANQFAIYTKNVSDFDFIGKMEYYLSQIISNIRLTESGLDPDQIKQLTEKVHAKTFQVGDKGAKEESGMMSFSLTYMMVFVMYLALLFYGTFVMRGIIEDKNSRVMEMVIASAKPHQLLAGKILGIGSAGLTQFFIWAIFVVGISTYGLTMVKLFVPDMQSLPIPAISPWIYVAFIGYFLMGFFVYASLFASLGSMVENESESQSMQMPVVGLLAVAFLTMIGMVRTPDAPFAIVMSLIPFFSPIIMFMRIANHTAPLWQVLLSVGINILSIVGLIWCAGRIFRVGSLMYGKRPTLPEVLNWIRS